ncbi:NAD(P)H-hydrate dehydratase [Kamptonema cortianum]|nr:NAD(P)H-hydrate dehydratase [Geitlerinema splendidum]MDK3156277.1 NAD(P)H-hydrate dehydratase [Kamptonema cortianum]
MNHADGALENRWITTAAESRELDRRAQTEYGLTSSELMESAAAACLRAIQEYLPQATTIAIICGKGNNGGDGIALARLASSGGLKVRCLILAQNANGLSSESQHQLNRLITETSVQPIFCPIFDPDLLKNAFTECDLIVDGILGTGSSGQLSEDYERWVTAVNESGHRILAIDQPTGVDTDTGAIKTVAIRADYVVTFGCPKPYLFQGVAADSDWEWQCDTIGFPVELLSTPTAALLWRSSKSSALMPAFGRSAHKGSRKHVLIVAGSTVMPGAAYLSALAAYRAGAGLVTVASVESVCRSVSHQLPEAIMLPLPESEGFICPNASERLRDKYKSVDALVFGPGLGDCASVRQFLSDSWENLPLPSVIDADALNAIANGVAAPNSEHVLTPHPGELARLLNVRSSDVQSSRFESARSAAKHFASTVVLKGAYSITSQPGSPIRVNASGNPGMATAGSGDVLTGVIATLLAQGLSPFDAASVGVYWHGMAGDLCAKKYGSIGFTSSEIANTLPTARDKIASS